MAFGLVIVAGAALGVAVFRPTNARLTAQGQALLDNGQTAAAWAIAEQLLARAPSTPGSWRFIEEAANESEKPDVAAKALAALTTLEPDEATHWTRFGALEMKRDRAGPAEAALARALEIDPRSTESLRLSAQLEGVLGRSQELSRTLFNLVRQKSFTMADLIVLAATDPFVADDERLAALERAAPDDDQPDVARARIALNQDDVATAETLLRKVIASHPENWDAQALLGKILSERSGDEFLAWQRALGPAADEHSRVWLARGQWLRQRGELESACRCFWEALLREPELLPATTGLAQTLRLKGELAVAEQFAERGRRLQEIRDLVTRIDDQQNLRWSPTLISRLEQTGRLWEAWAWCAVLAQSQPFNATIPPELKRLASALKPDLPRTLPDALPGRSLDWSGVPLPDWTKFELASPEAVLPKSLARIRFEDQAAALGLNFTYANSDDPKVPGRFIFESTGGGVSAIDFDRDGWPDLYFPQAGPWPVVPETAPLDRLFRNRGGAGFTEITAAAQITEPYYGQGVGVGDIDNDGFPDLYVANIGRNTLLRNNGDGTFSDVTVASGLTDELWTVSTAIADLNLDGLPDLFDVNYLDCQEAMTTICVNEKQEPRVCRPTIFECALDNVAINRGDGTFRNLKDEAGLNIPHGRGLGLVVADFNDDHRPDVFVANDQAPNHLLLNESDSGSGELKFQEQGMLYGVALDRDGYALAFMGIACSDLNHDGRPDLYVTTFAQESNILFLSQPDGSWLDNTRESDLRAPSFSLLGFGTQFLDADHDGESDLLVLNGHIDEFSFTGQNYRMRAQCFRGGPNAKFEELFSDTAGEFFQQERLGRGLATLDWNRDGRLDFAASDLEAPVALGTNLTEPTGGALRMKFVGTESSRDAIGAKVRIVLADGLERRLQITSGDGYESASERMLHVGTGMLDHVARIEVRWPSGTETTYENVSADRVWLAIEGQPHLVSEQP